LNLRHQDKKTVVLVFAGVFDVEQYDFTRYALS